MIQEKDFLYRVPVKNALITTPGQQVRNPEILVDVEGGEFMHGNILDANSTNKLINQSVKDAVDNKLIESGCVTKDLLEAETTRATEQENSLKTLIGAETSARTKGDEDLSSKIKAEQTRAEGKEKEISDKLAIVNGDSNTEGSFRKAIADVVAAAPEDLDTLKEIADKLAGNDDLHTALNQAITEKADASALLNEVTRATGAESGLQAAIATKADATALSNYVLTTALNKQVDTLNAAISAKQDAGNYIPYDASVQSLYQIDKELRISIGNANVMVRPTQLYCSNGTSSIDIENSSISLTNDDGENIRLGRNGVTLPDGDNNRVLTSNGSTINITEYATKSDLSSQLAPKADRSDLMALEQKITANTTAIEGKQDKGKYITYSSEYDNGYTINWELTSSDPIIVENSNGLSSSIRYTGIFVEGASIGSSSLRADALSFSQGGNKAEYSVKGIYNSQYKNCLVTSDRSFKPISDFVLKTELPTVPTKTSQLTNDSNFIQADTFDKNNYYITNILNFGLENNGVLTIDSSGIRSNVGDGFMLDDTGITFMGRSSQQIPTAGGDFINISDLASAEDISSLSVGLSKKQNKITVNEVDVTDIETADITKLRTIVTNLINALSESDLIRKTQTLE